MSVVFKPIEMQTDKLFTFPMSSYSSYLSNYKHEPIAEVFIYTEFSAVVH